LDEDNQYGHEEDQATDEERAKKEKRGQDRSGRRLRVEINRRKDQAVGRLARMRALIKQAVPDVVETMKWGNVPVWEHDGIICTGETYKEWVKITFAKGASLKDPTKLFNSSLDGNVRRAIDLRIEDRIDEKAFKTLIQQAADRNQAARGSKKKKRD
jgi:hypothetical protein